MYFLTRKASNKCLHENVNLRLLPRKDSPGRLAVTCQSPDGAHPVAHMEARPAEGGGDEGPAENGCGPSDLRVSMVDVVQDV